MRNVYIPVLMAAASQFVIIGTKAGMTTADATGDTNAVAIQAALTAIGTVGGGMLFVDRPGTYLYDGVVAANNATPNYTLNAALVVYSNTSINCVDGVVMKLANASNLYAMRNSGGGNTPSNGTTTTNSNITITGGKWDFNYANQTSDPRGLNYWHFHGWWFDYIDGLLIEGVEQVGAKKYPILFNHCTRLKLSKYWCHATNSDGPHVGGGCSDFHFVDCTVTSVDNSLPFISDNAGYYGSINVYLNEPAGSIHDGLCERCLLDGGAISPIRLAGTTGNNIYNITFRDIQATTTSATGFEFIDDTSPTPQIVGALIKNIVFDNCQCKVNTNGFMFSFNCNGFRSATIVNCTNPDNSQNLIKIGSRSTAWDRVSLNNCSDEKAYRGTIYLETTSAGGQLEVNGGNYNVGADGRVFQSDGAAAQVVLSNINVRNTTGSHSSDALVRLDANANCPSISIPGGTTTALQTVLDLANTANPTTICHTGATMTGYGTNSAMYLLRRNVGSKAYICGSGLSYTDFSTGWNSAGGSGLAGVGTGTGYCRINNPSLFIIGRLVLDGTPPSLNDRRGDRFFNTDSNAGWTGSADVTTPGSYGPVLLSPGTSKYIKNAWT